MNKQTTLRWVNDRERKPEPQKVVAAKVLFEDNGPRRDWELHWAYTDNEGKWQHIKNPVAVEWLEESESKETDTLKDGEARCFDCGLPYSEFGLDLTLPNDQWQMIGEDLGLLCGTCICKRADSLEGTIAVRASIEFATPQQSSSPSLQQGTMIHWNGTGYVTNDGTPVHVVVTPSQPTPDGEVEKEIAYQISSALGRCADEEAVVNVSKSIASQFKGKPLEDGEKEPQKYVCGFLFSPDFTDVVLIEKKKPEWQAGKLNGVGGKIEEGETAYQAMVREFKEETGLDVTDWSHLIDLGNDEWRVHFFYGISDEIHYAETKTEEEVSVYHADRIDDYGTIPNLRWLIPMAINKGEAPEEFEAMEEGHASQFKGKNLSDGEVVGVVDVDALWKKHSDRLDASMDYSQFTVALKEFYSILNQKK